MMISRPVDADPAISTIASELGIADGDHRRDDPALAVADDADAARRRSPDGCGDTRCRLECRRRNRALVADIGPRVRPVHAAIVETKHGDAPAAERVSQLAERTIARDRARLLVAIFGPRAGDRDDRRRLPARTRRAESSASRRGASPLDVVTTTSSATYGALGGAE